MKFFFIASIGCVRRHLDCERIKKYFVANGINPTGSPENADYLFVSTCGLNKLHEDLSIDDISRFKRFRGKLVVGGCLPEINPERVKSVFNGETISVKNLDNIDSFFPDFKIKFKDVSDGNKICLLNNGKAPNYIARKFKEIDLFFILKFLNLFTEFYRKFLIKNPLINVKSFPRAIGRMPLIDYNNNYFSLRISWGCVGACSYCNIKRAIGNLKSKPILTVLEEVKKGIKDKQYKINIISSDSGSYGLDIGLNLPYLLNSILEQDKRLRIAYLGNLQPVWMCRYEKELSSLVESGRIKSMMSAVQSGSERILKLMKRDANIGEFKNTIKKIKKLYPPLRLRTQIIVGFPSETEQDAEDTINLIKDCKFDEVDVFRYYETKTMPSADILPKIPDDIAKIRMGKIRKILPVSIKVNYFN